MNQIEKNNAIYLQKNTPKNLNLLDIIHFIR